MTCWLFLSWWMLKVRILSPIFQPCKASTNNVLKGGAKALWLCTLKRYEAAIYVALVALLLCSRYSFLSDKRTDSTCWATALMSKASGVTQIYFGLSQGGTWPRETRDWKMQRWESCGTSFREYPWISSSMGIVQCLVQATLKSQKIWSFLHMLWKTISRFDQPYYLKIFPVLPFNFISVICYVKFSKVYIFFHMRHQ